MKSSIYKKLVDCCESNDLNLIMSEEECRGYVGSDIYLSRKYDDAMAVINEYG